MCFEEHLAGVERFFCGHELAKRVLHHRQRRCRAPNIVIEKMGNLHVPELVPVPLKVQVQKKIPTNVSTSTGTT